MFCRIKFVILFSIFSVSSSYANDNGITHRVNAADYSNPRMISDRMLVDTLPDPCKVTNSSDGKLAELRSERQVDPIPKGCE